MLAAQRLRELALERDKLTVLAIGVVAMVASSPAQSFITALFIDDMLAASGLSRASFSLLFTVSALAGGLGVMWVGRLIDRAPPARIWTMASVGLATALALASLVQGPALVVVVFFLLRLFGMGSFTMLGMLMVSRSFRGNRGKAVAMTILGLTVTSIFMPPFAAWLIDVLGWQDALRVLALGIVGLILPLAVVIHRTGVGHPPAAAAPIAFGARRSTAYPEAFARRGRLPIALPGPRMRRLMLILTMPPIIVNGLLFHATALLRADGLSSRETALALSVQGIASTAGLMVSGAVVDRLRTRRALVPAAAVLSLAPLMAIVPSAAAGFGAYLLLGLGGASSGVIASVVWPRIWGTTQLGRLQGTSAAVQTSAAAVGPLPLALSQSITGGFEAGLVALSLAGAVGLAAALRWRDPRRLRAQRRPARGDVDEAADAAG